MRRDPKQTGFLATQTSLVSRLECALILGIIGGFAMGCEPEVETITWEPIDYEDIISQLEEPSGELGTVDRKRLDSFIANFAYELVSRYVLIAETIILFVDASDLMKSDSMDGGTPADPVDGGLSDDPVDGGPDWEFDDSKTEGVPVSSEKQKKKTGTYLFLRAACPGTNIDWPLPSFDNGEIRIDSSDLNDFSLSHFQRGAHLYFRFIDCQTPAGVLNAATANYIYGRTHLSILVDAKPFGLKAGDIQATAMLVMIDGFSVLVSIEDEGDFRFDFNVENGRVEIAVAASDGAIKCLADEWGSRFYGCSILR